MIALSQRFYAPINAENRVLFSRIRRDQKSVQITSSEERYEGCKLGRVKAHSLEATDVVPAILSDSDAEEAWDRGERFAWVVQNPDDSFWWDTLSLTHREADEWMGEPGSKRRLTKEALNFRVVPVLFEIVAR